LCPRNSPCCVVIPAGYPRRVALRQCSPPFPSLHSPYAPSLPQSSPPFSLFHLASCSRWVHRRPPRPRLRARRLAGAWASLLSRSAQIGRDAAECDRRSLFPRPAPASKIASARHLLSGLHRLRAGVDRLRLGLFSTPSRQRVPRSIATTFGTPPRHPADQ